MHRYYICGWIFYMKKVVISALPLLLVSYNPAVFAKQNQISQTIVENSDDEVNNQDDVIVVTSPIPKISKPQSVDSAQITQMNTGDGNITDLLKTSPAVQMSNSSYNGMTQGEIKPADISIHGNTSYQNNYQLDSVSFNNDVDPVDPGLGVTNTRVDSDEQGLYIDSRLINEIKLYDNNIPVEYGGFTGGVVDVISRHWNHETNGSIFYRRTHSSWNKTHVDPAINFDSSANDASHPSRFQPKYSKQNFGGWFETGITDNLGLMFAASRRESDISSVTYQGPSLLLEGDDLIEIRKNGGMKNQTRVSDNFSSKFTWYATDQTIVNISANYSKYDNYSFAATVANSGYDTKHNGLSMALQLMHEFDFAKLDVTTSYQMLEDKRTNDQNYFVTLVDYSDWRNPVQYHSGGVGNLTTKQNNWGFKSKLEFMPINWLNVTHEPSMGFELTKTKARYIRNEDFYRYTYTGTWDSLPWLSFADHASVFQAGRYQASYDNYTLFADDTMQYGRLTVRPGIRIDYDSFIKDANLAPRLVTSFDAFGNGNTVLTTGFNRYYGRTMMAYALYGAQNAGLKNCYYFCTPGQVDEDWISSSDFEGLDSLSTPYNDEISLGIEQIVDNSLWQLQYVHRKSYDEVRSRPKYNNGRSNVRTFDNSGRSKHDTVSLTVKNRLPIEFYHAEHTASASISWQQSKSNSPKELGYAHYDPANNVRHDKVWYNGKIINASDLPATDFNIPVKVNVELTSKIPEYDLTLYNLLQWQSSRHQAVRYSNQYYIDPNTGNKMAKYEKERFASTFRWDTKLGWTPSFAKGANFSVEVNNILNKKNVIDRYVYGADKVGNDRVVNAYAPGRQFWIQVGYDF